MSNFLSRLILTLVSIPLLIFLIFYPKDTHIFIILIIGFVVTFLGSYEMAALINKKNIELKRFFLPVINLFIFISAYIYANNLFNVYSFRQYWLIFFAVLVSSVSFIFARDIFKKDLKISFEKMSYTIFGIIYIGVPSFLIPFIFNLDFTPNAPAPIFFNVNSNGTLTGSLLALYMIVIIFSNDIFCYVFGMLFGKNNIIGLTASPKKSRAGYIGGFISTFIFSFIYYFLFERIFCFLSLHFLFYIIIPLAGGFLVPIGDLVESVIKRSSQVKDSGNLIMGRGGVLDSVDSILYFIPIYFVMLQAYFSFL